MRNVLITGGSRGIGAECVKRFAENGDKVYFMYLKNESRAAELEKKYGAVAIRCDVSLRTDVKAAADKILSIGNIDVIVNNAGISQIKMFQDITEADWDRMFDVNVKGIYNVIQSFLPSMIHRKYGRIINISSMWGEVGGSCEVHYSASKAAVIGLTKALAKELAPSGITVNCVTPGVIDTEMNAHLSKEDLDDLCEETPVCRIGTAKDVASAVQYLADDSSSFVTGTVLPVNGGIIM